jgi:hypothetical protein
MFTKGQAKSASKDGTCLSRSDSYITVEATLNFEAIHLTLEVNTFRDRSKPGMGPSMESSPHRSEPPTDSHRWKGETYTQDIYKAKLEQLRSTRLTRRDQAVTL